MDLVANLSLLDDSPALVSQWLAFYRRHGVTRFHIALHEPPGAERRSQAIRPLLSAPDLNVFAACEAAESEQQRVDRISDYCAAELHGKPFVLTADSDEFISWPARAAALMLESGYDFVTGMLVDRFELSGRTVEIRADLDLPSAFPLCTHFTWAALAGRITKIPVSRPGVRFRSGLHALENEDALRRPEWWVPVDHFKWRAGVIQRIRDRVARGWGGDDYLKQCSLLLEKFAIGEDRIDLSGIARWWRPQW
jgi:hypothetical protein